MNTNYIVNGHTFILDQEIAEAALAGKRVINGSGCGSFDLLPVKYPWACEKYGSMMANHWEPEDIQMQKDVEQWRSNEISQSERWIIMMGIGYFSAAEGIVGDNIQHVVRELVTAPELKMVLGRHAHEENIHADSLLYMISSLGINPHECEAMFEQIPTIVKKNEFVTRHSHNLRSDLDLTAVDNKQLLAKENLRMEAVLFILFSLGINPHECEAIFAGAASKSQADGLATSPPVLHRRLDLANGENRCRLARDIFHFGQCVKGLRHYALFAAILDLDENKVPGVRKMLGYILRDESSRVEVLRNLFLEMVAENPELKSDQFRNELAGLMRETVASEKEFARESLAGDAASFSIEQLGGFIDYAADCRMRGCGLASLAPGKQNPFPKLSGLLHLRENPGARIKQVLQQCVNDDEL